MNTHHRRILTDTMTPKNLNMNKVRVLIRSLAVEFGLNSEEVAFVSDKAVGWQLVLEDGLRSIKAVDMSGVARTFQYRDACNTEPEPEWRRMSGLPSKHKADPGRNIPKITDYL